MLDDFQERVARLVLKYGEDAARDWIDLTLEMAELDGVERARASASAIIDGGILPEVENEATASPGRPGVPDAALMAVWATVTIVVEHQGVSVAAACADLCREKGSRRRPLPTGIALTTDNGLRRWNNPEMLRDLHKRASRRRDTDSDFCAVCDLVREQLQPN